MATASFFTFIAPAPFQKTIAENPFNALRGAPYRIGAKQAIFLSLVVYICISIIGYTMTDTFEFGDLVGDWYLFGRMLRLGSESNPHPLLKLSGDLTSIHSTEAVLTPFGEEVLAGTASNYPANPIDDWAGGVRLSSEQGALWFNDGGRLVRG